MKSPMPFWLSSEMLSPKTRTRLELRIFKALRSAEKTLQEHVEKLPRMKYKSQVEGTIRNVQRQIETIKQFIKDKGLE